MRLNADAARGRLPMLRTESLPKLQWEVSSSETKTVSLRKCLLLYMYLLIERVYELLQL